LTRERWKATRWEGFSTGLGMKVEGERKVSATFVFQSKRGYDWLFFFFNVRSTFKTCLAQLTRE
jgi:hypothetical protein